MKEMGNTYIGAGSGKRTINCDSPNIHSIKRKAASLKPLKKYLQIEVLSNMAEFHIFFKYLNTLYQNKNLQKKEEVEIICFLSNYYKIEKFIERNYLGASCVVFKHKSNILSMVFDKQQIDGQIKHYVYMTSENEVDIELQNSIFKTLFNKALNYSNLKNSYLILSRDDISWKLSELEKRDFNDIYLPQKTMQELDLFVKYFEQSGEVLRYLFVGNPGTGKTESSIVIENEMKKRGVTIIKITNFEGLKDKVELAEILKPSLLVVDDIDMLVGSRSKGGYTHHLQEFLDVLDGTEKIDKGVGIIATTNSAHLLDLAAQRPGRFDNILLFDSITEDNIKNIIIKSLKVNFGIFEKTEVSELFTRKSVVKKFDEAGVTGAHIYNDVYKFYLKVKALELDTIFCEKWILDEIDNDINKSEEIRKQTSIKSKLEKSKRIGFHSFEEAEGIEYEVSDEKFSIQGDGGRKY